MNISKERRFDKKVPTGCGRFLKKFKDDMYAKYCSFFLFCFVLYVNYVCGKNKILDNTYGSLFSLFIRFLV